MIQIKAPDGSIAQFPEGTPDGTIQSVMAKTFGGPSASQPGGAEPATGSVVTPSLMQAFARGDLNGPITPGVLGPPAKPGVGADIAKAIPAGLMQTVANAADIGYALVNPNGFSHHLVSNVLGNPGTDVSRGVLGPTPSDRFAASPQNYQPQTAPGRYAKTGASMIGNAVLAPGGFIQKAAAVVLPTLGQQGATDAAKAAGFGPRGQAVAGTVGAILGGGAAGMVRPRAPTPVLNPTDAQAAQAVKVAMAVDGTTPADITAGMEQGRLPLATSPGLAQLGETVTTLPGPGQVAIRNAAAARMGTQTERALGAVETHLGVDPEAARGNIDAMVQAGQAKAGPIYDAIRSDPAPVWNSTLQNLAQRPAIKKAIGVVTNDMLNAGQNPKAAGFRLDPDTGWQIGPSQPGALDNIEQQPTAATWDAVYKAMGRTVDRHPLTNAPLPDSVSAGNRGITTATADLRSALAGDPANGVAGAIPNYGQALATSGDYLSTAGAFNRARGKLMAGSVYDFNHLWNSAKTPADQAAIRSAMANDVLEATDRGRVAPGLFRSPGVQKKLSIAFGDQAEPFINQMESDAAERNIYSRITGGSPTASRQALIDQARALNKPAGVAGAAGKVLGAAEWLQSMAHPGLLMTKLAHAGVDAAGKGGKAVPLPWENPEVSARLGGLLSDPDQMRGLLGGMDTQGAMDAARAAQGRQGLLTGPAMPALGAVTALGTPAQAREPSRRRTR